MEEGIKVYKNMVKARTQDCINYKKRIEEAIEELEKIGDFYTTPIGQVIHLEEKINHINKTLKILKGE